MKISKLVKPHIGHIEINNVITPTNPNTAPTGINRGLNY